MSHHKHQSDIPNIEIADFMHSNTHTHTRTPTHPHVTSQIENINVTP